MPVTYELLAQSPVPIYNRDWSVENGGAGRRDVGSRKDLCVVRIHEYSVKTEKTFLMRHLTWVQLPPPPPIYVQALGLLSRAFL